MLIIYLFILSLTAQAYDKTEVQVNICESFEQTQEKLNLTSWLIEPEKETYFFETKNLKFYRQGWVFKASMTPQKSTVKITLKNNSPLSESISNSKSISNITSYQIANEQLDVKCEYDLHGNDKKLACKLDSQISIDQFNELIEQKKYSDLLSADQRNWLKSKSVSIPKDLEMTDVIRDQNYENTLQGKKIVMGSSFDSRHNEYLEISVRTNKEYEKEVQSQLTHYLISNNVELCQDQGPVHTKNKLESYFRHNF